jgi:hypothetical protein
MGSLRKRALEIIRFFGYKSWDMIHRRNSAAGVCCALAITFGSAALAQDVSSLKGAYGFQIVANQLDSMGSNGGAVIGVVNFDGAGNLSGTGILKARTGLIQDGPTGPGNLSGTYTVNPDSTGIMTLRFDFGFSPTLAFTITDGGKNLFFIDGPRSTNPLAANPTFQGSPTSLSGTLPASFFIQGATGTIPLTFTLTGSSTDVPSIYALSAPGTGQGTLTCGDGTTGTWQASVPSATAAVVDPDGGNFFLVMTSMACGGPDVETYSGFARINPGANGLVSLVLRLRGFTTPGSARAIGASGAAPMAGAYGFQLISQPFPNGVIGVLTFDGNGGVTGSINAAAGAANAVTGTYSTNSDGTGSMKLTQTSNPAALPTVYAFVVTDGGSSLYLLEVDDGGNGASVSAGTARLQTPPGV